jgi:hypothetical protein
MKKLLFLLVIILFSFQMSYSETKIGDSNVVFATVDEGIHVLTSRDDFVSRMTPLDRAVRMRTVAEVSEEEYLGFIAENILEWKDEEKERVISLLDDINIVFENLPSLLPQEILFIKTTGREEGRHAYTRGNTIVLPASFIYHRRLAFVISHELFHIISRYNPGLREKIYSEIGFFKCEELILPPELESRRITNPDAPINEHFIRLSFEGEEHHAMPILLYDAEEYFESLFPFQRFVENWFLLVEFESDTKTPTPICVDSQPLIVKEKKLSGLFEQIGKNSEHPHVHPEEILADNFAYLVLQQSVNSPGILEMMEKVLLTEQ